MMLRRWILAAAILAAVAATGVVAYLALDRGPDPLPPPQVEAQFPEATELSEDTIDMAIDPEVEEPAPVAAEPTGYTWQQRRIGGGGWVKGIEIHPSGEPVIARTDVGGAYRFDRDAGVWAQLILEDTVPGLRTIDYQVDSIALAPSDPDRIYLAVGASSPGAPGGRVLVSRDGGATWATSDQPLVVHGNGQSRNGGERMSVSPTDPDDVWFGGSDGLFRSRDAGATFEPVASAPRGDADVEAQRGLEWVVARADVVYIGVSGAGVYRSLDDGASWEQLWATVGRPFDAEVDDAGILWAVSVDDRIVRRYDPATAAVDEVGDLTGRDVRGVAVRPDGSEIIVATPTALWRSTDGGASFQDRAFESSCPGIPWQQDWEFSLFTASSPEFDPMVRDTLWIPEGFGIWAATSLDANRIELACRVTGVEEIVVNDLLAPRGDVLIAASWDRALFHLPAGGPATATIGPSNRFNGAWSIAATAADPNVIAAVVADQRFCCEDDGGAYQSGRSFDGGVTWEPFESYSNGSHPYELRFGNIAIAADDIDTMVWLPTFNAPLYRTEDGGASWTPVIVPGTEASLNDAGENAGGSHFAYYLRREVLIADPVAPATFYLFHQDLGLHRSTDGGATWELQSAHGLPTGWTAGWFNAELNAVPGRQGHLVYTPGRLDEVVFPMYESLDGGATWTQVRGTSQIDAIGFGAPVEGSSEPTVYIAGSVNAGRGIYRSNDLMATWELVDTTAGGIGAQIDSITGDPEIPGRVYVGFSGVSVMQGDEG